MNRRILLIVCSIMFSLSGYSIAIEWGISPVYDDLKLYSDGVFYCSKGGKWGLVTASGKLVLQPEYDYITPFIDGYALAGVKDGSKNRISCIIDESYSITEVGGPYYLVNKYYTYFSEDKLPVANKAGKQGFINTSGDIVVKCQFDNVHPFANGFASVSKYPHAYYITDRYDRNPNQSMLPVEFNYGDMTFATTFYNGKAVVAYNDKAAVINTSGKKVGNYSGKINSTCYNKFDYTIKDCGSVAKGTEYSPKYNRSITAYSENGVYGYSTTNEVVVYPSFTNAEAVLSSGDAIVTLNGKVGLLHFVDASYSSCVTKNLESSAVSGSLEASTSGAIEKCDYVLSIPATTNIADYAVYLDNGSGSLKQVNFNRSSGVYRSEFTPEPIKSKGKELTINAVVRYKNLTVHKYSKTFDVKYPVVQPVVTPQVQSSTSSHNHADLHIVKPKTQTAQANDKDVQVIVAEVCNHGSKSVTVTATISVPSKNKSNRQTITIPAGGTHAISVSISNVLKKESVSVTVTLSSGETSTNTVTLKPYY